jgi:addiction module HigA family antidote
LSKLAIAKEFDMATMHSPAHPGEILREDILPALGLSVTEAAGQLGVTRVALSRVLNARAAISSEMALRLEKWLGAKNGPDAKSWLSMQSQYDLWHTSKAAAARIRKIKQVKIVAEREAAKGERIRH